MDTPSNSGPISISIPLDASSVDNFQPDIPVKVALLSTSGVLAAQIVKLDEKGQGVAQFDLKQLPGSVRVVVGPSEASDQELTQLQTISATISTRTLANRETQLAPIVISSFYWHWWHFWCRTFTITGRVVCPDGSPVPGATVCAYDIDWWWWWTSQQQVGCATTDASGAFTITFRWCCGWWPWWWWRARFWQLEPKLVEKIHPLIEHVPSFKPPIPSPRPSLDVFTSLAAERGVATRPASAEVDLAALPMLRDQLLKKLPISAELAQLRVWPWFPWQPWWDCTPDVIFKVTQECQGQSRLIVDEQFWDTRWDIPTSLSVTLVASQEACCIHEPPPPEGNCVVISSVCDDLVNTIGGNPGAPAAPAGYLNPSTIATFGDRPYAGVVPISGLFGSGANVDYYEAEWATSAIGPWNAMPPAAAGGFSRTYWGPQLVSGPVGFHNVAFSFTPIGGRLVVESREHFEANNDPSSWGLTRFWVTNRDLLFQWLTATTFADGTYYLRLAGYSFAGGVLGVPQILPLCDTEQDNGLVLTIDNSTSVLEPAADIVDVRINGVSAGPCSNVNASSGGTLDVDFVAYDVDSHLAEYSLIATYGKNLAVNLLTTAGATLTPVALGTIPAADFQGPDYGAARVQGAVSPHWRAGGLRLSIPDLRNAFPETCCYQLELRVYKRSVVSCDHNYTPSKLSFYSLTVVV
jgi:hypothetical protein